VQLDILLHAIQLYEFDEPWECALGMHHLEDDIVFEVPAIIQQKRRDDVERGVVFFLDSVSLTPWSEYSTNAPVAGSILSVAAHSPCGRHRGHLPAGGICISRRCSRFGGTRLLVVSTHVRSHGPSHTLVVGRYIEEGAQRVVDDLVLAAAR
jgi:hypothetical protein